MASQAGRKIEENGGEPERQVAKVRVLVSPEHRGLTPVFGTACPPRGLSGLIRRYAFTRSEGVKSHWLLLVLADRVDVIEGIIGDLLRGTLPNPYKEMALGVELRRGAYKTRFGQGRADIRRQALELAVAFGGIGLGAFWLASLRARRRRRG